MKVFDTVIHRWLRVPYTLHATVTHPKGKQTFVFIHGIGNNGSAWRTVVKKLPPHVRVITVDLLGFGQSAKPKWATYNARTQARAVAKTLFRLGVVGKVTLVGHSLGSLVAVECARRYPFAVRRLILCSPPFYQPNEADLFALAPDRVLRTVYRQVIKNQHTFLGLAAVAMKYKLVGPAFSITAETVDSYMATLKTMIINQTVLHDIADIKRPIDIIVGAVDPFIVQRNIRQLAKQRSNITVQTVPAAHEVTGLLAAALTRKIATIVGK